MKNAGVSASAVRTEPITNSVAYNTSIRRPRRCTANWTAITVPKAYAALAIPVVSWRAWRLSGKLLERSGSSGLIAELSARYGISANTTSATAAG
ncbi:MAG: hypothetical protein JO372_00745 [Solirubrobacterales bacterium]|nr:hypothetical protein [Solirubrobacterales bacterium]